MVAGIGASAGGLEAFSALLEKLPSDTGMSFVFVQHLDPHYPSLLAHLLSAKTAISVSEATDGVLVAPDHVYVVPPGVDMVIEGARLKLTPRDKKPGLHLPIDAFLRTPSRRSRRPGLWRHPLGAASDGAQGLAAIKSEGGVTFAQEPATADYPSMPATAIAARVVDFVLPPREIATELARLGADPRLAGTEALSPGAPETDAAAELDEVFALLRDAFRVDFSAYKLPTVRRRLARRVLLRRCTGLGEYLALLRSDPPRSRLCTSTSSSW